MVRQAFPFLRAQWVPQIPPELIPKHRARRDPKVPPGLAPKQTKNCGGDGEEEDKKREKRGEAEVLLNLGELGYGQGPLILLHEAFPVLPGQSLSAMGACTLPSAIISRNPHL